MSEATETQIASLNDLIDQNEFDSDDSLKVYDLPYDILFRIFEFLDYKSLHKLSLVNKKLNKFANDNYLWKKKLLRDIQKWRMIDSKTFPKELYETNEHEQTASEENLFFKKIYLECCPEKLTHKEILKKLETFQQLHLTSTSEKLNMTSCIGCANTNFTLSSLSSLAMPIMVFGQLKDFIYRNVFSTPLNENSRLLSPQNEYTLNKLIMFGPGLETTTSCLVTNILWKSEFKTIGMIPGKDGYGSGIELKLYNHKPFNLTILYTNVSKIRNTNNHDIVANRLFQSKSNENNQITYELQPQVKEACSDALGFIYVIDNKHLSNLRRSSKNQLSQNHIDNYKIELEVLMREVNPDLPLLILSCNTNEQNNLEPSQSTVDSFSNALSTSCNNSDLSCVQIIQELELFKLNREWQIRNCELFQKKMKDIVLGFEWILNKLDQKYLTMRTEKINSLEE